MRQNASTTCLRVQAHEWAKAQGYDCKELFNLGFYFIHGPSGIAIQVFQSDDDGEFFVMQTSVSVGGACGACRPAGADERLEQRA